MEKDLNQQLRDAMADSFERLSKEAVVFQNDIIDKALSSDPKIFDGFGSLIDADIKAGVLKPRIKWLNKDKTIKPKSKKHKK